MKRLIFALLCTASINAYAQKLPNTQQVSLRAPANIKVDGKATDWGDNFAAYNNATNLFYSMANNDSNLYIVLQTEDEATIKKILNTSITLTLRQANKSNRGEIALTFPASRKVNAALLKNINEADIIVKSGKVKTDSVINDMNNFITQQNKLIKVRSNRLADSLIAIYNDYGINVAARFNAIKKYTFEFAVPLKYIAATPGASVNFNIKIEGILTRRSNIVFIEESDYMRSMNYDTDFSGTFSLAK